MGWQDIVAFVEHFQTLLAGVLAIAAAWIAYRGALRQAAVVLEAERQRLLEQQRAVARAMWAELNHLATRLFADSQRLLATSVRDGRMLGLSQLDLSVFAADPSAIGRLPPDDALVVTQVYKVLNDLNGRFARVSASPGVDDNYAKHLGQELGGIVGLIRTTLHGLQTTAGLPDEKAKAAMTPWTPVVKS